MPNYELRFDKLEQENVLKIMQMTWGTMLSDVTKLSKTFQGISRFNYFSERCEVCDIYKHSYSSFTNHHCRTNQPPSSTDISISFNLLRVYAHSIASEQGRDSCTQRYRRAFLPPALELLISIDGVKNIQN